MDAIEPDNFFFTFLDGALAYDCPSCGAQCCKNLDIAFQSTEALAFARLGPTLASRLSFETDGRVKLSHSSGCAMLKPDGWCAIEVEQGYSKKPSLCRLFPFSTLRQIGEVSVVDFSRHCPLQDSLDARSGQRWAPLLDMLGQGAGPPMMAMKSIPVPEGAERWGWLAHERHIRDSIPAHLAEADYATFASFQDAAAKTLLGNAASPVVSPRDLRELLARWRKLTGVELHPRLEEVARTAARQTALLTSTFRFANAFTNQRLSYADELLLLPKFLLATSHLIELDLLGRRSPDGLRAAAAACEDSQAVIGLLASFDSNVQLSEPIAMTGLPIPISLLLGKLSSRLLTRAQPLGLAIADSFGEAPAHLRLLALSALGNHAARIHVV